MFLSRNKKILSPCYPFLSGALFSFSRVTTNIYISLMKFSYELLFCPPKTLDPP